MSGVLIVENPSGPVFIANPENQIQIQQDEEKIFKTSLILKILIIFDWQVNILKYAITNDLTYILFSFLSLSGYFAVTKFNISRLNYYNIYQLIILFINLFYASLLTYINPNTYRISIIIIYISSIINILIFYFNCSFINYCKNLTQETAVNFIHHQNGV